MSASYFISAMLTLSSVTRQCRSAASHWNEGAWSRSRSAPDIRQARLSSCVIMQLPRPTKPSAIFAICWWLNLHRRWPSRLDYCNAGLSIRQHPEATACSEQCS